MDKIYNFATAPAMLPEEVLLRANRELFDYEGTGMSPMELAPTSLEYKKLAARVEELLREVLNIPANYRIMFLSGDGTTQFSAIPLNLLSSHKSADYVITGQHSKQAYLEAKKYGDIAIAASTAGASPTFSAVPELKSSDFRPDADYVYVCYDNSIYGTSFRKPPETGSIPLVADMSSFLLSEPIDVSRFALIFARSGQNIGIAGMTVVIIRDDIIGAAKPDTPSVLDYKFMANGYSNLDTPPVFCLYMAKLTFEWILSLGGLDELKRRNERKAVVLYDYIDDQHYYTSPVDKGSRSICNVRFLTGDAKLDEKFVKEAAERGLINLEGDHSVGGMCASLYNGMTVHGVDRLVQFMSEFAAENPKLDGYEI